jgi:hypothetical protein
MFGAFFIFVTFLSILSFHKNSIGFLLEPITKKQFEDQIEKT